MSSIFLTGNHKEGVHYFVSGEVEKALSDIVSPLEEFRLSCANLKLYSAIGTVYSPASHIAFCRPVFGIDDKKNYVEVGSHRTDISVVPIMINAEPILVAGLVWYRIFVLNEWNIKKTGVSYGNGKRDFRSKPLFQVLYF